MGVNAREQRTKVKRELYFHLVQEEICKRALNFSLAKRRKIGRFISKAGLKIEESIVIYLKTFQD